MTQLDLLSVMLVTQVVMNQHVQYCQKYRLCYKGADITERD